MTVQGMHPKQKSQPPHSQSKHPALGPVGLVMDDVELLDEVGKTELIGSSIKEGAIMIGEWLLLDRLGCLGGTVKVSVSTVDGGLLRTV